MKVLIVGAGAVGGYFGAKLARAGHEVVFTARGKNLQALIERGLAVESFEGDFVQARIRAAESASGQGPFSLVLVCVKAYDTARAIETLGSELELEASVISLQNGVESEPTIERLLGLPPMIRAVAYVGAELVAPGVVRRTRCSTGSDVSRMVGTVTLVRRAASLGDL